jgi:hypothetical protein
MVLGYGFGWKTENMKESMKDATAAALALLGLVAYICLMFAAMGGLHK